MTLPPAVVVTFPLPGAEHLSGSEMVKSQDLWASFVQLQLWPMLFAIGSTGCPVLRAFPWS